MATVNKNGSSNVINTVVLPSSIELPIDVLTSTDNTKPLSAKQGKVLNDNQTAETTARTNADNILQSNINEEASTRSIAITGLQSSLDTESSSRSSADSTLQSNIDTEASTRSDADSALSSRILEIPVFVFSEVPTIDGATLTLLNEPITGSVKVIFNGDLCDFWTIDGVTITFPEDLDAEDVVTVDYAYTRTL